jgi:ubiquinol-cytochrome c reductase iron-sulfur subunit
MIAASVALASTVWAYAEYIGAAREPRLALALAGAFWGIAFTLLLGFRSAFVFEEIQGPRPLPTPADAPLDLGLRSRRRFVALLGTATASLVAVVLLPFRSLGGSSSRTLHATAWRRGVRLLSPSGTPLRAADLLPGSATPVVPAGAQDDPNSVVVLVRLRSSAVPRAYSRMCTHAGCAVSMFRSEESQLVCPCHFSVFDAASGGVVLSGPASQPLPELLLATDAEGFLIADGGFNRPIGPLTG